MSRGANRLVRFLRIFDFGLIESLGVGQKLAAVLRVHQLTGRFDGNLGQVGRIGSHVGDVPVLVERLSRLHRAAGGEAELAVGLLLQRAGRERRTKVWR